ncbi:MAG: DUF1491 family protein [Parvularculaceae bacterium]|nr:DUF1491 family protein [Parvularculaceae bacterium]
MRLRSDLLVSAVQRQAEAAGCFVSVLTKGHESGGMIFIKWVEGRQVKLFTEGSSAEGRVWLARTPEPQPEAEANAILDSERSFDPDLWIVEVEGPFSVANEILSPQPLG